MKATARSGDTAELIGVDTAVTLARRVSCVFVRQAGRWRCVLTHLSRLSGPDA